MENECVICFEIMKGSAILECEHKMCIHCCLKHFHKNKNCPFCRKQIIEIVLNPDTDTEFDNEDHENEIVPLSNELNIPNERIDQTYMSQIIQRFNSLQVYIQNCVQTFIANETNENHTQINVGFMIIIGSSACFMLLLIITSYVTSYFVYLFLSIIFKNKVIIEITIK